MKAVTKTVKIGESTHDDAIKVCTSASPKFKLYDYIDMAVKKENERRKKKEKKL